MNIRHGKNFPESLSLRTEFVASYNTDLAVGGKVDLSRHVGLYFFHRI
jgi:hypothetical protein